MATVIGVIAVAILALLALGGSVLWTRPFWMDEVAMFFLTSEGGLARMIGLVARGADWNPPTLHLLVWSAMRLFGMDQLTPAFLRSFTLLCVAAALCFTYCTLRRRYDRLPSSAGVLSLLAQGLVVTHAFEGRFYGPWLLFAAAFVWALGLDSGASSRRRDIVLAIVSVLLCTIHWYGVFSLGLAALGVLMAWRSDVRRAVRLLLPATAGVVALLALIPIALSQRTSAASVLWVHPLSVAQVEQMASQFIPGVFVVVLALLLVADAAARARPQAFSSQLPDPGIAALFALGAMPVVLIVLSAIVTPSMVFRYAIVAALAWAALVAFLSQRWGRPARWATAGAFAVLGVIAIAAHVKEQRQFSRAVEMNASAFRQAKATGDPVVFQRLHVIYPVAGVERGPTTPARYIDIPDSVLNAMYPQPEAEQLKASFRLDRDQARYHAGLYGWPVMAPVTSLDTTKRFYFVATDATLPPGYSPITRYAARLFPRHSVKRLGPALAVFERIPGRADSTAQ